MSHKFTIQGEGENGQGPMKVFIINQPVKNVIQGKFNNSKFDKNEWFVKFEKF